MEYVTRKIINDIEIYYLFDKIIFCIHNKSLDIYYHLDYLTYDYELFSKLNLNDISLRDIQKFNLQLLSFLKDKKKVTVHNNLLLLVLNKIAEKGNESSFSSLNCLFCNGEEYCYCVPKEKIKRI